MASDFTGKHIALGVDIGGTFTDVVLVDERTHGVFSAKVLTTPGKPEQAVLDAIEQILGRTDAAYGAIRTVVHGTTLATNAIIERKGARTMLLTTRGFRDALETATELRYDLYDLFLEYPEPLVPRRRRIGISERTRYDGELLAPLEVRDVNEALAACAAQAVESLAICFLHSYANPRNEEAAADAVKAERPDLPVTLSSRVLPEIGEYGRVSTTVANAYVQPLVAGYLSELDDLLRTRGSTGAFFVMSSSGGTLSLDLAREFPVRLVESGPAAGVSIAAYYAQARGVRNLLAFDMGGTTAKLSLITDGQPTRTTELEVARVRRFQKGSGLLLKAPAVDLIEIGAGGGSIAAVDALGLLAVGPESAGSDPGPACYGRGGTAATVTDADVALGYLNPEYFLGGEMRLDRSRSLQAIEQHVASALGLDPARAARSIFEVVNDNMANAAAVYAADQGIDLRDYTMLAFGGAAPTHAWDIARRLRIKEVRVPFAAGVLSALGCLTSPVSFDFVFGYMRELRQVDWDLLNERYAKLEAEGRGLLADAGLEDGVTVTCSCDMRYFGQRYEVTVPLPSARLDAGLLPELERAFYSAYRRYYGREIKDVPVETVSWRLNVSGPRPQLNIEWQGRGQDVDRLSSKGERAVIFPQIDDPIACSTYERAALPCATELEGPVVIEDRESTTVVPPGASLRVDNDRMLIVDLTGITP